MELLEEYLHNPCGTLSIPYWKSKCIQVPSNMQIVHHRDYSDTRYSEYEDETYFRLIHLLKDIESVIKENIVVRTTTMEDIPLMVDVINR